MPEVRYLQITAELFSTLSTEHLENLPLLYVDRIF